MSRRRSGLGVARGDRYALLPEEVMESVAYHAQPDWARTVLFALACRYQGHNNGDLSLTFSVARRLGIAAQWKLYAGLKVLERADLIITTRRGRLERGKKIASLFALTWRGIDACEGVQFDPGISSCPLPSNAWVKWQRPADWPSVCSQIARYMRGRKTAIPDSTHDGEGRSTHDGATHLDIAPHMMEEETMVSAPHRVETSKTPGRGPQFSRASDFQLQRVPPEKKAVEKIEKLDSVQLHLTHADIAKITGESVEPVQQLRRATG